MHDRHNLCMKGKDLLADFKMQPVSSVNQCHSHGETLRTTESISGTGSCSLTPTHSVTHTHTHTHSLSLSLSYMSVSSRKRFSGKS